MAFAVMPETCALPPDQLMAWRERRNERWAKTAAAAAATAAADAKANAPSAAATTKAKGSGHDRVWQNNDLSVLIASYLPDTQSLAAFSRASTGCHVTVLGSASDLWSAFHASAGTKDKWKSRRELKAAAQSACAMMHTIVRRLPIPRFLLRAVWCGVCR